MGRGRIARGIVVAAALLALTAAPASAADSGEVGGPPTDSFAVLPKGKAKAKRFGLPRALSPAIVIGVADTTGGRVELVAQNSTKGLCVSSSYVDDFTHFGACSRSQPPPGVLEPIAWAVSNFPRRVYSSIAGLVSPEAASVSVALESRGKRRYALPTIVTPDASILARLGVSEPFSYFHADYKGCMPPHKTVALGYDETGTEIANERGPRFRKRSLDCGRTAPHTSRGTIFYAVPFKQALYSN